MHLGHQQALILGPPGCGKTTALLQRVEQHLDAHVAPERIAYFSFTRKAVEVARTRAAQRFDLALARLPYFRTIHSMAFALNGHSRHDVMATQHYREVGALLGVEFSLLRRVDDAAPAFGQAEGDVHLFLDALARARCIPLAEQFAQTAPRDVDLRGVERTLATLARYKRVHGLVDYVDMLERYLKDGPALDIDVAFIDEAQDLSRLQWHVLARMLRDCPEVHIAGDDDQAVHVWSGADVETFLALDGTRHALTQSHRCARAIHDIAASIAARIHARIAKEWEPRQGEEGSVERLALLDTFDFSQLTGKTLCLARNTYLLATFTRELRKQGFPYLLPNYQHSVRRDHARAILAWTTLQRGGTIGGSDARLLIEHLRVGVGIQRGHKTRAETIDNRATFTLAQLREQYGVIAQGLWYEALDAIAGRDRDYYRAILRAQRSLINEPMLQVNTIHGVKGDEADNVVLLADMAWRSYDAYTRDADAEHRVAYVAVSRARSRLFLIEPQTRNFYAYIQ